MREREGCGAGDPEGERGSPAPDVCPRLGPASRSQVLTAFLLTKFLRFFTSLWGKLPSNCSTRLAELEKGVPSGHGIHSRAHSFSRPVIPSAASGLAALREAPGCRESRTDRRQVAGRQQAAAWSALHRDSCVTKAVSRPGVSVPCRPGRTCCSHIRPCHPELWLLSPWKQTPKAETPDTPPSRWERSVRASAPPARGRGGKRVQAWGPRRRPGNAGPLFPQRRSRP